MSLEQIILTILIPAVIGMFYMCWNKAKENCDNLKKHIQDFNNFRVFVAENYVKSMELKPITEKLDEIYKIVLPLAKVKK